MKKKILVLSVVIILLTTAVVGGSLAWFTDTDSATNTFTVGSVKIAQNEDFDSTKASNLMPVIGAFDVNKYVEDNYIRKIVNVTNTGKNNAYVQTFVAMPKDLVEKNVLGFIDNENTIECVRTKMNAVISINGVKCVVYRYRYKDLLEPGQTTSDSLRYMYIASDVNANTYDTNGNGVTDTVYLVKGTEEIDTVNINNGLHIYVFSQAVQAQGFTDADNALDTAFNADALPDGWA